MAGSRGFSDDFEDEQFGGYSVRQLEMLLEECNFLDLMERPGLWRTGLRWAVMPGMRSEAVVWQRCSNSAAQELKASGSRKPNLD